MWQRLEAIRQVGDVKVLATRSIRGEFLEPPPGVTVEMIGDGRRREMDLERYPRRVRAIVNAIRSTAQSGLIWANSNLLTRRAAFAAARLTGWPVVLDVWDTPDLPMWSLYREGRYLKALVHWTMNHGVARHLEAADLVVWTLHPDAAPHYFRPDNEKLFVLPNGLRRQELAAYQSAEVAPLPRQGRPQRLLYVGYFQRSRGSRILVELIDRLRRDQRHVKLDVAGETSSAPVRDALRAIPQHLQSSICFHGHLPWEQAMNLLRDSDLCLYPFPRCPELEYIFPLKLLEYAALSKRIVSSDLPGARLLLRNYPSVRFCDPAVPTEWANVVGELLEAPQAHQHRHVQETFLQEYDWDRLNRRLVNRINSLVEHTGMRGRN